MSFTIENRVLRAFEPDDGVTDIVIPDDVTVIAEDSCVGKGLTSVVIPKDTAQIKTRAFSFNPLRSITIEGTEFIGNYAFFKEINCEELCLSELILGHGIKKIGAWAFRGNIIREIVLPDSITYIGTRAFADSAALERITINGSRDSLTVHTNVFVEKSVMVLLEFVRADRAERERIFSRFRFREYKTALAVFCARNYRTPDALKYISENSADVVEYLARSCDNSAVDELRDLGCTIVNERAVQLTARLVTEDGVLLKCIANRGEHRVIVPEGIITIAPNAFEGCTTITSAELPSTLENVGTQAFYGCPQLESITLHGTNEHLLKNILCTLPPVYRSAAPYRYITYDRCDEFLDASAKPASGYSFHELYTYLETVTDGIEFVNFIDVNILGDTPRSLKIAMYCINYANADVRNTLRYVEHCGGISGELVDMIFR